MRFASGNSVPVERSMITRDEYELLKGAVMGPKADTRRAITTPVTTSASRQQKARTRRANRKNTRALYAPFLFIRYSRIEELYVRIQRTRPCCFILQSLYSLAHSSIIRMGSSPALGTLIAAHCRMSNSGHLISVLVGFTSGF